MKIKWQFLRVYEALFVRPLTRENWCWSFFSTGSMSYLFERHLFIKILSLSSKMLKPFGKMFAEVEKSSGFALNASWAKKSSGTRTNACLPKFKVFNRNEKSASRLFFRSEKPISRKKKKIGESFAKKIAIIFFCCKKKIAMRETEFDPQMKTKSRVFWNLIL